MRETRNYRRLVMQSLLVVMFMTWMGVNVFATALSAGRDTPQREGTETSLIAASNVIIYAGSIVCVNSSGYAVPGADTSGFAVVGRAEETVDNRTAVYVATKKIKVSRGVFRWANADSIEVANIGSLVYVTEDATVTKTGGGQNIIAGTVVDVDSSGVWIDTGKVGPSGAATPSSLAVTGAATAGTTITAGTKVIAGTQVTSYGYPAMASHTNGSAQVYLTQTGTITGDPAGAYTATNTFAVTYIATPTVMWRYNTAGIPATNATTIASNAFTIAVCQSNGTYIAVGRIK